MLKKVMGSYIYIYIYMHYYSFTISAVYATNSLQNDYISAVSGQKLIGHGSLHGNLLDPSFQQYYEHDIYLEMTNYT